MQNRSVDVLPLGLPGMRYTANYWAEHQSSDEGEENKVDKALESIVTQTRHGLDIVLQKERTSLKQTVPK